MKKTILNSERRRNHQQKCVPPKTKQVMDISRTAQVNTEVEMGVMWGTRGPDSPLEPLEGAVPC